MKSSHYESQSTTLAQKAKDEKLSWCRIY